LKESRDTVEIADVPGECNQKKLYFLKTHKTASSVVENILMR